MEINELLTVAVGKSASDLHLKVGTYPIIRINGELMPMEQKGKLSQEDAVSIVNAIMNDAHKKRYLEKKEVDLSYGMTGLVRFRVNVFQQRGTIGMVFRVIPTKILSIQELFLPPVIEKLALEHRGMILVTGTTGSGKSTSLASMVDYINQNRMVNIMTIEDPIEFLHRDKK